VPGALSGMYKSPKWDTPFREHYYTVLWFSGGGPKTDHEMEK